MIYLNQCSLNSTYVEVIYQQFTYQIFYNTKYIIALKSEYAKQINIMLVDCYVLCTINNENISNFYIVAVLCGMK